jgi:RimJ/RimL family protein N-acetyltransferase
VLILLPDRRPIVLRRIRAEDKGLLVAGLRVASPDSVYLRFLGPKPRFTARELRYLTEVDFRSHYALVAIARDDPEWLAGVGRWVRDAADPTSADVAVFVADPLQGQGLGTEIGLALADAARERGVRRFTATMHPENRRAHRLFATLTARLADPPAGGVGELAA